MTMWMWNEEQHCPIPWGHDTTDPPPTHLLIFTTTRSHVPLDLAKALLLMWVWVGA